VTRAALVAIQLEIGSGVLASPEAYRRHLEASVTPAVAAGAREADARLLVMPEIAGHLALYALAPPLARKAKTLAAALAASAVRRPLDVLRGVATTRLLDPKHAVIAALAPDGERFWKSVFGPLAREHRAYIVAGSFLRLAPDGELHNASLLFAPDGKLVATTDKVNLLPGIEDGAKHGLALARGSHDTPITETSLGRIATLIGYDGFAAPFTRHERFVPLGGRLGERGGVTVVAHPSANPRPWAERAAAWESDGLRATLRGIPAPARLGVTAHLVGRVVDLAFEGVSEIAEGARVLSHATCHDRGQAVPALVDL